MQPSTNTDLLKLQTQTTQKMTKLRDEWDLQHSTIINNSLQERIVRNPKLKYREKSKAMVSIETRKTILNLAVLNGEKLRKVTFGFIRSKSLGNTLMNTLGKGIQSRLVHLWGASKASKLTYLRCPLSLQKASLGEVDSKLFIWRDMPLS